jgi:hypothetical protein
MDASFIFQLGKSQFGFPAPAIQQTLVSVTAQPVPWMPSFHHGLFHLRGEILPLLDLRRFLNQDDRTPPDGNTVLIVNTGSFRFGTMTGAPRFVGAPEEPYPLHPEASLFPALDGAGEHEGKSFALISPERLQVQLVRAMQCEFQQAA